MKRHSLAQRRTLWVFSVAVITHLSVLTNNAFATDYSALRHNIALNEKTIEAIETDYGRYDRQLLEPLEQLAKIQLEANRFDDAAFTVKRAIQIARYTGGLYSGSQYPLLQLEIEISRSRGNWKQTEQQLAHYFWLVTNKFDGDSIDQLNRLSWLADSHLECAMESSDAYRTSLLIKATSISEFAVQLAQVTRNTQNNLYHKLLYDLSQKYYVETRGILGDKVSGNKLRVLNPQNPVMETRTSALDRRYAFGLEKLRMIRDTIANSPQPSAEALAMAEMYIADWQLAFNRSQDVVTDYSKATALLHDAGFSAVQLDRFFAHPVVIPRKTFTLSFSDALAELESVSGGSNNPALVDLQASATESEVQWRIAIKEDASAIPGLVTELPNGQLNNDLAGDWNMLSVALEIDPHKSTSRWNRGYRTQSLAIASAIETSNSSSVPKRELQQIMSKMRSMSFRPALRSGVPVASTIAVDYVYQADETAPASRLVTLQ